MNQVKRGSIVLLLIVVVLLFTIVLTACNMDSYIHRLEFKGYLPVKTIVNGQGNKNWLDSCGNFNFEWQITYSRESDFVTVTKYVSPDVAIYAYDSLKDNLQDGYAVKRHGYVVVYGTKRGVRDAG